jgi:methyl-accepting chemotaxis protein
MADLYMAQAAAGVRTNILICRRTIKRVLRTSDEWNRKGKASSGGIDMKFKFSIMKKVVLGITAVSAVTYGTSAFFILVLKDYFDEHISEVWFTVGTLLLGIFWTGLLGMLAANRLIKPLKQLMQTANRVSEGYLNVEVVPPRSDDELRALAVSFDAMIRQLRTIVDGIADNYKATHLHVGELGNAIEQATRHIRNITDRVDKMSDGAEHQSKSTAVMFQSLEMASSAANEISELAEVARRSAVKMDQTIRENGEAIASLVEGMRKMADLNRESIETVRRLDEHAGLIGNISEVVAGIADQTHMLSLNASIEAARAGEEGRGFAVVAESVRKLAQQSAESVQDIRQLIEQIQQEIKKVVEQISEQYEVAEQESEHGEKSAEALRLIAGEADNVHKIVVEASNRVMMQAEQMNSTLAEARAVVEIAEQIREGAQQVFASTQEQYALMQEITSTSEQLQQHSSNLRKRIEFFKS